MVPLAVKHARQGALPLVEAMGLHVWLNNGCTQQEYNLWSYSEKIRLSNSVLPSCITCSHTSTNGMKLPNLEQQTQNPPKILQIYLNNFLPDVILASPKNVDGGLNRSYDRYTWVYLCMGVSM